MLNDFNVNIYPNQILKYWDSELQFIELNIFYISEMTNQKALDLFVLLDGHHHMFQITIGIYNDINHRLIDVAEQV